MPDLRKLTRMVTNLTAKTLIPTNRLLRTVPSNPPRPTPLLLPQAPLLPNLALLLPNLALLLPNLALLLPNLAPLLPNLAHRTVLVLSNPHPRTVLPSLSNPHPSKVEVLSDLVAWLVAPELALVVALELASVAFPS